MTVTIFTAAYNRIHTLPKLYESIKHQTSNDFEWIIVDDGSTDGTSEYINQLLKNNALEDKKIKIVYFKQENGGKHRAFNKGIELADSELFFSVDSDDTISNDAVEKIIKYWNLYRDNKNILGLCFRRGDPETKQMLGSPFKKEVSFASPQKINYLWGKTCDKAEIFRTEIIKNNKFPTIDGEKFLSEAAWIFPIAKTPHKNMICLNEIIRYTKYYEDGLTRNWKEVMMKNPRGYIRYYKTLLTIPYSYLHPRFILGTIKQLIKLKMQIQNENKEIKG